MTTEDNRILKASFRECPLSDRKEFPQSACVLPISVGQSIHEGKKFLATIKLINSSFRRCTLLIDDSVQRHTKAIDIDEDANTLYELAVKDGENWLKRNGDAYKQLSIPYNIMRWDDWLSNDRYQATHLRVKNCYFENESYQHAIDANIHSFLARYLTRLPNPNEINYKRAFLLCLDYLLEECAVMCLWTQNEYEFEVYPSGRNQAMGATYELLIKPLYPRLLRPVALRFKKYPSTHELTQNDEVTFLKRLSK